MFTLKVNALWVLYEYPRRENRSQKRPTVFT